MKTLLLGPNGQLGTDIRAANEGASRPLEIVSIDRSQLDLSNLDLTRKTLDALDFDAIINCSSYHKTDEVEQNAQLGFTINAHLVKLLAEICQEKKARFVHFSTDYVFGGGDKIYPLTEQDAPSPVNVYGASKLMGEGLSLQACDNTLILRVASLFGLAGASGKGGNFVETMIRLGKEQGHLKVVRDQNMSPTSTADISRAVLTLLENNAGPGIWHVVNSGEATWFDFAKEIMAQAGVKATVEPITSREFRTPAARPRYSQLSNAKLTAAIGPVRHWKDALADYLHEKGYSA